MPTDASIAIAPAAVPEDLDVVRALFREYAAGLGFDLAFQGFEAELAALPGKYAPPAGRLLVARRGGEALGCVALRPTESAGTAEMKRLFVRPAARGLGLGRRLAERICDEARAAGHRRVVLDTVASMTAAIALCESLGFRPVPAYVFNPLPDARFFGRDL